MASSLKKRNNRSLLKICVSILERLLKNNSSFILLLLLCYLLYQGPSDVAADEVSVSVKEGDLVFLQPDVKTNQQDRIRWYFSDTRIAQITGDLSQICTDVQCNEGTERFRHRLKLDHQTGSLTITNTRTTDSGVYRLQISSRNNSNNENIEEIFSVTVQSYFSASTAGVSVFVMERDSVTFQTGVETTQQGRIRWYFSDVRIAQITGNLSNICTDVQCNEGTERFRDRLRLDNQTGSLTITYIRITDSGLYELIISSKINVEKDKTFKFALHDVSAAEQYEMKEGESVTLSTGVINTNDVMTWYFDDTRIAEITGDQRKICADDQCNERFRDRLKLDHQTGSLTITNTRTTDSGLYELQLSSSRFSIIRKFTVSVTVTAVRDPGPPSSAAGIIAAIIVGAVGGVLLVAFVIYCCYKRCTKQNDTERQNNHDEENGTSENLQNEQIYLEINVVNGSITDQVVANETSVISSLHQHQ